MIDDDAGWLTCSLGRWMRQQRSVLATLERSGNLVWLNAAAEFSRLGLTDHLGQPPTAATAQETWRRVNQNAP